MQTRSSLPHKSCDQNALHSAEVEVCSGIVRLKIRQSAAHKSLGSLNSCSPDAAVTTAQHSWLSSSAHRQCWGHLMENPAECFTVNILDDEVQSLNLESEASHRRVVHTNMERTTSSSTSTSSPSSDLSMSQSSSNGSYSSHIIEIILQEKLLKKLPLILDVVEGIRSISELKHRDSSEGRHGSAARYKRREAGKLMLSCSVWGIVSLLLLLSSEVTLKHWFASCCPDSDPGLPAETLKTDVSVQWFSQLLRFMTVWHSIRHILQAAQFMGCQHMSENILEWMKKVLYDLLQHNEVACATDWAAETSECLHHACPRNWHNTKVLQSLDKKTAQGVFKRLALTQATQRNEPPSTETITPCAFNLPQDLFSAYISTLAPVLNLSDVKFTPAQWVRIAAAISQYEPDALHTVSVSLDTSSHQRYLAPEQCDKMNQLLMFMAFQNEAVEACCCSCGARCEGAPTLVTVGSKCSAEGCSSPVPAIGAPKFHFSLLADTSATVEMVRKLQHFCSTSESIAAFCGEAGHKNCQQADQLCVGFLCMECGQFCACGSQQNAEFSVPEVTVDELLSGNRSISEDVTQILCTLGWALSHMTHLRHLTLKDLVITPQVLSSLGQMLSNLPHSVSELTVTIEKSKGGGSALHLPSRRLFFKAITSVAGLRVLTLPEWEVLVGLNAKECVEELLTLPVLETVHVPKVKEGLSGLCGRSNVRFERIDTL